MEIERCSKKLKGVLSIYHLVFKTPQLLWISKVKPKEARSIYCSVFKAQLATIVALLYRGREKLIPWLKSKRLIESVKP